MIIWSILFASALAKYTDNDINALEDFIWSQNKSESLQSFAPNSEVKLYLEGNLLLLDNKGNSNRFKNILEKLKNDSQELFWKLNYRSMINKLEIGDAKTKKKIMENFKEILYPNIDLNEQPSQSSKISEKNNGRSVVTDNDLFVDLSNIDTNVERFRIVQNEGKWNLNVAKMNWEVFQEFLYDAEAFEFDGVAEKFGEFFSSGLIGQTWMFPKMTIAQLEFLFKNYPVIANNYDFLKTYFSKKYKFKEIEDERSLYKAFSEAWTEIKDLPENYYIKSIMLYNLLCSGIAIKEYDETMLLEYMNFHRFADIYKDNNKGYSRWAGPSDDLSLYTISENELLQTYFNQFFKDRDSTFPYEKYITKDSLNEFFGLAKLFNGEDPLNYEKNISKQIMKDLLESSELELCKNNPKNFNINEEAKLCLSMRNIQNLIVSVYEINTKTYYTKKEAELTADIDIEGFIAGQEYSYAYKASPFLKREEEFSFPTLSAKRGTFIIDFIGNGRESRAMITRGNLKYIITPTEDGQQLTIFDENSKVCSKQTCGIILDGKFYQVNSKGICKIPFAEEESTKNLIVTDGEISLLVKDFQHLSKNYELKSVFLLYEEQFLYNQNATIQIKPSLFMNNFEVSLSLLGEFEITLHITSIDQKTNTKIFKASPVKGLISINFQVPFGVTKISISVKSSIKNDLNVQVENNYSVSLNSFQHLLSRPYLRKTKNEGFILEIRGRNGELYKGQKVIIDFHIFSTINSATYFSDNNGKIYLGELDGVSLISVNYNDGSFEWTIADFKEKIKYPEKINIREGESIELDYYQAPLTTVRSYKKNTLFKIYKGSLEKDFTDNIKYEYEKLKIKGLSKGIYFLQLRTMNAIIAIEVAEGDIREDFNYLMSDSKSLPHKNKDLSISIKNIKEENMKLNIEFSDDSENGLAHILFCNYLSGTAINTFNSLNSNAQNLPEFYYNENKVSYLKSRRINEEFRYVLDRKKQLKYPSINFPKPQLVLKRQKVKDTDTEIQEVDEGEAFQTDNSYGSDLLLLDYPFHGYDSFSDGSGSEMYSSAYFLNFLENSSIWRHLTIPSNHKLIVNLEESYSQAIIFAYKNGVSTMKIYPIETETIKLRPMISNSKIDDVELHSEQIKNASIYTGETIVLQSQDITSIEILDSIESLQNMQIKLLEDSNEYKEWLFLSTWNSINEDKKNYYFDKYFSHELNLFLYFKDKVYFNAVVKPFISNKMEKDVIDKYLVGESLGEYTKTYWKLNCLEKVLLIEWGIKQSDDAIVKEVKNIAQDLINYADSMIIDEEKDHELLLKIFQFPQQAQNNIDDLISVQTMSKQRFFRAPMFKSMEEGSLEKAFAENEDEIGKNFESTSNLYKPIKKKTIERTKEYKETYYFSKNSLQPNRFWKELAQSILLQKKILTPTLIFSLSSLTELISILAFMDLPISSSPLSFISNGSTVSISSDHNFLAFYKDLSKTPINLDPEILVSQKFINPKNPNSQVKQFLTRTRYKSKIIVTNASDMDKFVYVLLQVPDGSIPVSDSFYSKTESKKIGAYQTEIFSYQFYFPEEGNFTIHPIVVTRNQNVIGNTGVKKIEVLENIKNISAENIEDFAINGNEDEIMKYLQENNLYSSEELIRNIYHRMKNCNFYTKAIAIFKEKKYFDEHLYLYSILHEDYQTFYDLLVRNEEFIKSIGYHFESSIIKTSKGDFTHYEYFPLINARAHNLGSRKAITNLQFKETYYNFLMLISEKNKLDAIDYICLCQYYILQDRYTEALSIYNKLKELGMKVSEKSPSQGLLQIQFDYLSAFLDSSIAKDVSSLYTSYPVETWRNNFMEIYVSLDSTTENQTQGEISNEPALSFTIENDKLSLTYQNVKKCEVKIYYIDLEVLFSKNPFFIQDPSNFVFLAPNLKFSYDLPGDTTTIQLPNEVKRKSFVVEIDYGEYSSIKTAFNAALKTMIIERYGHIKVMDENNNPRSTTYVKVFAKLRSEEIEFYKDGYTDKRGAFDFISMNYDKLSSVEKFAILAVDEELGSLIVEANPPKTFTKDL